MADQPQQDDESFTKDNFSTGAEISTESDVPANLHNSPNGVADPKWQHASVLPKLIRSDRERSSHLEFPEIDWLLPRPVAGAVLRES